MFGIPIYIFGNSMDSSLMYLNYISIDRNPVAGSQIMNWSGCIMDFRRFTWDTGSR